MNARLYDQTFGRTNMHADRQTNGRTDERSHTYALGESVHAHTRTLACLHTHMIARTNRHTHTCSYIGKLPSTNMDIRSQKLEVRSKKLEVRSKKLEVRKKKCPYHGFRNFKCALNTDMRMFFFFFFFFFFFSTV